MNENQEHINQAIQIAKNHPHEVIALADMILEIQGIFDGEPTDQQLQKAGQLAAQIRDVMSVIDETRFSMYDYADAVANAMRALDLDKLLNLDEQDFAAAMIWLAADKRETYEEQDHNQDPLELDIYV